MEDKKKIPEFRFEGFTDDWNNDGLENLSQKIGDGIHSTPKYDDKGEYFFINGNNLVGDEIIVDSTTKRVSKIEFEENKRELGDNSILLSINGTIGNLATYQGEKVLLGKSVCYINLNKSKIDKDFMLSILKTKGINNYFFNELTGSTIKNLSLQTIRNTPINYPKHDEQQQIGSFFKNIDELITKHQKKHDRLVTLKKSMLEKMFPKEGQTVPEIRFKGFKGDWDIMELGEVSPIRGGFAFKSKEFREKGVPIVKISNILPSGDVGGEFDFYETQDQDDQYLLPHKAAVLAMSGATTGKVSILDNPSDTKVYQNQRVGYFQNLGKANYDFISTIVRSELFNRKINSVLVAGAQPNVSPKEINGFEFGFPKDSFEQERIGQYFKNIDSLVSNHQKQLQKLQNFKQSLSEKMFV